MASKSACARRENLICGIEDLLSQPGKHLITPNDIARLNISHAVVNGLLQRGLLYSLQFVKSLRRDHNRNGLAIPVDPDRTFLSLQKHFAKLTPGITGA